MRKMLMRYPVHLSSCHTSSPWMSQIDLIYFGNSGVGMPTPVHIDPPALRPGMPVVVGKDVFGRVLITQRTADGKLVSIPVDWARNVEDGRIVLWIDHRASCRTCPSICRWFRRRK